MTKQEPFQDVKSIFGRALEIGDPRQRDLYLDEACADAPTIRVEVQELLAMHDQAGEFMQRPAAAVDVTVACDPAAERVGQHVGPYKLLQQIGEGGMGVVYMAEQEKPVHRKVALKIIKPGMDSKQVVARFQAERQALAMMDHPNIAKVFDAGTTDSGRPYFVMELVKGVTITEYCDDNKYSVAQRLELFIEVCKAAQHAHQKGVIHRDIKPSNVLVSLYDDKPVPKIIDFGIAKAVSQRLTEKTMFTQYGQIVGTLEYMSPEQARFNQLDVDTRSDIYSLGVLLYELLTGATPFDRQRLRSSAFEEVLRILREEEPPKPSTRISTLGDEAVKISANRGSDVARLGGMVRGDLDWIVMTALEKDRHRRYETANEFAADLDRFLTNMPVNARPPSATYRLSKLVRRNRVAFATGATVLLFLCVGFVAISILAFKLRDEVEQRKRTEIKLNSEAERTNRALAQLAESTYVEAVMAILAGDHAKASVALQVAKDAEIPEDKIGILRALIALNKGDYEEAVRIAEQIRESGTEPVDRLAAQAVLVSATFWAGFDWGLSEVEQYHLQQRLQDTQPQTEAETLLVANALVLKDPREAIRLLDGTPSIQRSPAGLFIRGRTRFWMGVDQQDKPLLERAVRDFEYASYLFSDNQAPLAWQVVTLAHVVTIARRDGESESRLERYASIGGPLAKRLAPNHHFNDFASWLFWRAIEEREEERQAYRRLIQNGGTAHVYNAAACLRVQDADEAIRQYDSGVLDREREEKWVKLFRAHVVRNRRDSEQEVKDSVSHLIEVQSPGISHLALTALCLVSGPADIEQHAKQAMSTNLNIAPLFENRSCVRYFANEIDETALLRKAGDRRIKRVTVLYALAMDQLAKGDRGKAYEYFKECVETNILGCFEYELASGYVDRIESDPNWPAWLDRNATD